MHNRFGFKTIRVWSLSRSYDSGLWGRWQIFLFLTVSGWESRRPAACGPSLAESLSPQRGFLLGFLRALGMSTTFGCAAQRGPGSLEFEGPHRHLQEVELSWSTAEEHALRNLNSLLPVKMQNTRPHPKVYWTQTCISTRSPGDLYAHFFNYLGIFEMGEVQSTLVGSFSSFSVSSSQSLVSQGGDGVWVGRERGTVGMRLMVANMAF